MLLKVGTDICSVKRIRAAYERFGERFLDRILTAQEKRYVLSQPRHLFGRLAGRFAAKEAASKALGTGWYGVGWKDFEIVRLASGEPTIKLHGRAIEIAKQKGLSDWVLSISHEHEFATSTVIAQSSN